MRASPPPRIAEPAGQVEARGDPVLVLRLGGDALRRRRLTHEREADVAEDDHAPEHQEGGLPVVLHPGVLEGLRRLQRERPAELVSRPPAHHRDGRPRGHGFPLRGADLLDPQRVDGDVLGRGGDGDDQADGDHAGQVRRRLDHAPQHQACQDHPLQGDDPGATVPEPLRQPGHPEPVDQRRPEEVDRVDPEDQAGPADGGAAQALFLQPQAQRAADQDPGKAADDPEQEDAGHAPLEVDRQRLRGALHDGLRRRVPPDRRIIPSRRRLHRKRRPPVRPATACAVA